MNKGRAGRTNGGQRLREAINWFVANESNEELRRIAEPDWEDWCARAKNRADYAEVIRLRNEIGALPPPTLPSREELLMDAAGGDSRMVSLATASGHPPRSAPSLRFDVTQIAFRSGLGKVLLKLCLLGRSRSTLPRPEIPREGRR